MPLFPHRLSAARLAALVACALLPPLSASATAPAACVAAVPDGPLRITPDCVDPQFAEPVIDSRTDLQSPYPLHRVAGHFKGTATRFNFYFPSRQAWQGRFFQTVYPMASDAAPDATLQFGLASGAYTVQTNSAGGYRSDAAAAKLARSMARQYYGSPQRRIFGYVFGGSGGSYQTIGAIENSSGVWDGAVPFVVGGPTSIPNNFFVRAFARLVLKDKAAQIADAVRPGGSGDPYAGLDPVERAMLAEVSAMGVPLRGWDDYSYLLGLTDAEGLLGFRGAVRGMDSGYAADFWSKAGYLGTERSALGDKVRAARVRQVAPVGAVARDPAGVPTGFILDAAPVADHGFVLDHMLLDASGKPVGPLKGSYHPLTRAFTLEPGNAAPVLAALRSGASVQLDNDWALALTSYHRHQVPAGDFPVWNQFRAADGTPRYPQRALNVASRIGLGVTGGGTYTGAIQGKVIVIGNALDVDAFPWHGDWYAQRVRQALGARFDDHFRFWVNDHADHLDGSVIASGTADTRSIRLINYVGIVQQAVRDLSAWVEKGVAPAPSTAYTLENGQLALGATAARGGIQPVIALASDGRQHMVLRAGDTVTLRGVVSVPPGAGAIVAAEWSQSGRDEFVAAQLGAPGPAPLVLTRTFTYRTPGVYYPVLRVTAQRDGDASDRFGTAQNLARIRIVVR